MRFCDIVARLYEDGVPLTSALDMLSKTEGFHYHARILRLVCNQFLQDGQPITQVTLQPGQSINGGPDGVTLELTETGTSLFDSSFEVNVSANEPAPGKRKSSNQRFRLRQFRIPPS